MQSVYGDSCSSVAEVQVAKWSDILLNSWFQSSVHTLQFTQLTICIGVRLYGIIVQLKSLSVMCSVSSSCIYVF